MMCYLYNRTMKFRILFASLVLLVIARATVDILQELSDSPNNSIGDAGEPLILTPYLNQKQIEQAKKLSEVHYKGFHGIKSYSGYFTVNKAFNSNLFFWFFPSQHNYANDPVVLWLQGGPGASDMLAIFYLNGPFSVNDDLSFSLRNYSWAKNHSMLYIDNPVGAGFSFTKNGYARNQTQVAKELHNALIQFFTMFPEIQNNEFFVAGESYAGKYIPALGHTILKYNATSDVVINLKGLLIGNGLVDPVTQFDYGESTYQLGLVDMNTKHHLDDIRKNIVTAIENANYKEANTLRNGILDLISDVSGIDSENLYNYIKPGINSRAWQSLFKHNLELRRQLHVGNVTFDNETVKKNLFEDIAQSAAPWLSEVINNYRVLLYHGQLDARIPYSTVTEYLYKLNFSGATEYKSNPRHIWRVDTEVAGYVKIAGNLTECLVRNAGHMVPMDQPKWAYDLIYKFIRNVSIYE